MNPPNYSPQKVVGLIIKTINTRLRNNLLNFFLVGVLFYVATQRTVNFEFTIGTSTFLNNQQSIANTEPKPQESAFSLGNFSFTAKKNNHEIAPILNSPNNHQTEATSKVKPEHAFAFIFFDGTPGEHSLDPALIVQQQKQCAQYIRRFAPVAISEMKKYGVPASIKIAQAILESNVGQFSIASELNNHFGIRCFSKSCKPDHCSHSTGATHQSIFRKYENAWASFRAHSLFVTEGHYQHLKGLGTKDYKAWAKALKKAGYSTDPNYSEKLIRVIERLELYQLDE